MRNNPGWKYVNATRGRKNITFGDEANWRDYSNYYRMKSPGTEITFRGRPINGQSYYDGPMFAYESNVLDINTPSKSAIAAASKFGASGLNSLAPVINALTSPAINKSQGDYSFDTIINAVTIMSTYYEVDDLDEVARIYESNGYAVSRYAQPNNLNTFHNRQLYDYLQCDDVNVCGIMDGTLLADFIGRLNAGIRLWHTDGNGELICTKSPFGIRLGVLCVRDNTEV